MKRFVSVFLALIMILAFSSCGETSRECDICGSEGAYKTIYAFEGWYFCNECYDLLIPIYEDSYDYDYDYDYDDYYGGTGYGSYCLECGRSIDEDRLYCDKCLGYGTCQDCGKSIDDDRLYCDKCLGYGTCQDCGKSIDDDRLYCDKCLGYGTCQDCGKSIASDRLYCDKCLYS